MRRMRKTRFAVVGIGYDSSASLGWPGARYAPESIRNSLRWILNRIRDNKIFDVDGDRLVDLTEIEIKDCGDLAVSRYDHEQTLREINKGIDALLAAGWTPIILGGDHSVSWPAIQAFHDRVEGPMGIIQLDAHLDLLDESETQGR
jgi:agmatinase